MQQLSHDGVCAQITNCRVVVALFVRSHNYALLLPTLPSSSHASSSLGPNHPLAVKSRRHPIVVFALSIMNFDGNEFASIDRKASDKARERVSSLYGTGMDVVLIAKGQHGLCQGSIHQGCRGLYGRNPCQHIRPSRLGKPFDGSLEAGKVSMALSTGSITPFSTTPF